jgi:hypothetical protein
VIVEGASIEFIYTKRSERMKEKKELRNKAE